MKEYRPPMTASELSDDLASRENLKVIDGSGKYVRQCRRKTVRLCMDGTVSMIIDMDEAKRVFDFRKASHNGAFKNWQGGTNIDMIVIETT